MVVVVVVVGLFFLEFSHFRLGLLKGVLVSGLFSRTTLISWYQKGKTILDFKEARDGGILRWQCYWPMSYLTEITISASYDTITFSLDAFPYAEPTLSKH